MTTIHPRNTRAAGLSLVEALVSIVIVGVMIVSLLGAFGSLAGGQKTEASRLPAMSLANNLMAEILACPYSDPNLTPVFGPETGQSGTTRAAFDDVDDYNGWSETPPKTKTGTAFTGRTGWTRRVAVAYADPDTLADSNADLGLKRITVTVLDPGGRSWSLAALRGRGGTFDQKPSASGTYVRWVGVELQSGTDTSARLCGGTGLYRLVPG